MAAAAHVIVVALSSCDTWVMTLGKFGNFCSMNKMLNSSWNEWHFPILWKNLMSIVKNQKPLQKFVYTYTHIYYLVLQLKMQFKVQHIPETTTLWQLYQFPDGLASCLSWQEQKYPVKLYLWRKVGIFWLIPIENWCHKCEESQHSFGCQKCIWEMIPVIEAAASSAMCWSVVRSCVTLQSALWGVSQPATSR